MSFLPTGRITQAWACCNQSSLQSPFSASHHDSHPLPYLQVPYVRLHAANRPAPTGVGGHYQSCQVAPAPHTEASGSPSRLGISACGCVQQLFMVFWLCTTLPQRANKSETPNTTFGRGHAAIFGRCNGSEWVRRAGQAAT